MQEYESEGMWEKSIAVIVIFLGVALWQLVDIVKSIKAHSLEYIGLKCFCIIACFFIAAIFGRFLDFNFFAKKDLKSSHTP